MIKISLSLVIIIPLICFAQWKQQEFVIGAYGDPGLTGEPGTVGIAKDEAKLLDFKNAGFNTLTGGVGGTSPNGWADGWPSAFGWGTTNNTCISYRLDRLYSVGGLKTFAMDEWMVTPPVSQAVSMINGGTLPGINPSFTSIQLSCFLGYLLTPDEPSLAKMNSDILPIQSALSTQVPNLAGIVALNAAWGDNLTGFGQYLDTYIADASTKIVYYDYYVFEDSQSPRGYFRLGASNVQYFTKLNMLATRVRNVRASGRNINMWGFGGNSEHIIHTESPVRHLINLDEQHLSYVSYAQLLYGAKGVLYYAYDYPKGSASAEEYYRSPCPSSTFYEPSVYTNLQAVNKRMSKMGPTLMNLEWQKTIHGNSIDPSSDEPGLSVYTDNNTPPFYGIASFAFSAGANANPSTWKKDSLAIGIFQGGSWDYLLILNKSLYMKSDKSWAGYVNNTKYCVRGNVFPRSFDKDNGGWKMLLRQYDKVKNATTFELTITPGDMQMVWLGPADITPITSMLLND